MNDKPGHKFARRDWLRFVTGVRQRSEMLVLGDQIVRASGYGAVGEDIVIRVGLDDLEVKRRGDARRG